MTTALPGKRLYTSLYLQVIVAVILGVALGALAPSTGEAMKPLGDGFIKLIKMIIAPVIFCTVVTGIAGMEDMKKIGRTGLYALVYFEVVSTVALLLGLVIVNVVRPGAGMHIDPATLDVAAVSAYAGTGGVATLVVAHWCGELDPQRLQARLAAPDEAALAPRAGL